MSRLQAEIDDVSERTRMMYFALVGALVTLWAYIENSIDAWVEVVHRTGGAEDIQPFLPPNLDRELDYLKEAWKTTPIDGGMKEEGRNLLVEIHRLKNFRHDLVHGIADHNDPNTLLIHMWRVKGADRVELKPRILTRGSFRTSRIPSSCDKSLTRSYSTSPKRLSRSRRVANFR